jgi:hypothetical protein
MSDFTTEHTLINTDEKRLSRFQGKNFHFRRWESDTVPVQIPWDQLCISQSFINHKIYNLLHEAKVLNSDIAVCLSQEKEDLIPLGEGLKNFFAGVPLYEI